MYRLTPKAAERFGFTAENVVDLFLQATEHWYADSDNTLHGKQEPVRKVLLEYLRSGKDTAKNHNEIYALMKFRREWMGDEGTEPLFERVE